MADGFFSSRRNLRASFSEAAKRRITKGWLVAEKRPHQGEPLRGGDTPIIAKQGYSGNIPTTVIQCLEHEIQGVDFGGVSLIVSVRDGHPTYRIEKTISVMTGV
jgi:hypothetical protein